MTRRKLPNKPNKPVKPVKIDVQKTFHIDFLNKTQELAWKLYQKHDVLLLTGVAGTGKTLLATAFAIYDILSRSRQKIVVTRPVVEAGENLGFLPGTADEKIAPYMIPIYDSIKKICGHNSRDREVIGSSLEVCPLAFMRGRTIENSVFILDEAQNCSMEQIRLAVSRLGTGSKMIITGDPEQSDLSGPVALTDVIERFSTLSGVGMVHFKDAQIVRHHLVGRMLAKLSG